ncbi:hypothetical protein EJB05_06320 [Eragrostis curvula]|uniref:Uncharacterized protein n=1 Tax=Eragrostis curvula TaxID=38414 RepID=A0A5J9WDI4_9POAL|nr:hypothetical protein EJB05_53966 [Eragrostis curvula]TVU13728.1 hypothetical protein EJB05_37151 [Eragrostis curvula]TVU46762.1 hypothetical protein EJB05_06320 [Eragrostis curvula]
MAGTPSPSIMQLLQGLPCLFFGPSQPPATFGRGGSRTKMCATRSSSPTKGGQVKVLLEVLSGAVADSLCTAHASGHTRPARTARLKSDKTSSAVKQSVKPLRSLLLVPLPAAPLLLPQGGAEIRAAGASALTPLPGLEWIHPDESGSSKVDP